jgi:uracil phosphoribosyltransferase
MITKPSKRRRRVCILYHPLIDTDMLVLRDRKTTHIGFRDALRRIARILAVDALMDMPVAYKPVRTPLARIRGRSVKGEVVFLPVLRAGLGLLDGFLDVFPSARVGHVGVYRDEDTLEPVEYLVRLPSAMARALTVVLDPMLATGGSASATLSIAKKHGARNLILASVIAAPEGVARLRRDHPDVRVITCAVDRKLNDKGFIMPGLGDAGDRLFGTL